MNIIIYKNDGRMLGINGVKYLNYDLSNKKVDFYFTDKKSYSLKLDEFWTMKVRDSSYGNK